MNSFNVFFITEINSILFKGCSIQKAFENSVHDLEVNVAGRKLGKENPNKDPEDIIKPPDGLPPDFR